MPSTLFSFDVMKRQNSAFYTWYTWYTVTRIELYLLLVYHFLIIQRYTGQMNFNFRCI